MTPPRKDDRIRHQIAIEAARLMLESGIPDFKTAKCKAANKLGIPKTRHLPRNVDIENAIIEYQRLFRKDSQPRYLQSLRETALIAMNMLEQFNPRLVGPVLRGTADNLSDINIHVFTDTPEEIGWHLMSRDIPYNVQEKKLRAPRDQVTRLTNYQFTVDNTVIELTVFPVDGIRQAPPCPVDGKPMLRASHKEVEQLILDNKANSGIKL
ncbi:MAG: hypothetical protein ACE5EH_01850 [Gammaproteobacteria bacterium]